MVQLVIRRNASGEITGLVGVGQDITEHNREFVRQKQVADELTQLMDAANTPIFGIDTDGNVNAWNQRVTDITGYSK
jgi:PAS domain-containing protein